MLQACDCDESKGKPKPRTEQPGEIWAQQNRTKPAKGWVCSSVTECSSPYIVNYYSLLISIFESFRQVQVSAAPPANLHMDIDLKGLFPQSPRENENKLGNYKSTAET